MELFKWYDYFNNKNEAAYSLMPIAVHHKDKDSYSNYYCFQIFQSGKLMIKIIIDPYLKAATQISEFSALSKKNSYKMIVKIFRTI